MKIYFIATQYKEKVLDINWNPLTFPEANRKLMELASKLEENSKRNQPSNITYRIISLDQTSSCDSDGIINRE